MTLNASDLSRALLRAAAIVELVAPELNELDGRLGDGDLGATLLRCATNVQVALGSPHAGIDSVFKDCATACSRASGSSFGTLLAVAFLTATKETAGRAKLVPADTSALLGKLLAALSSRGGASLGDKTVLDTIEAVRKATDGVVDWTSQGQRALAAIDATLVAFRDKPNRIGRARMFADRSVGLDDPGMIAFKHLANAAIG